MIILIWLLAAYGMSNILVYGSIFQGLRNWFRRVGDSGIPVLSQVFGFISDLVSCMMCTSTWTGFFMSFVAYSPWHEMLEVNQYASIFFDGLLASGFVWALNSVVEWFEENRPNNNNVL